MNKIKFGFYFEDEYGNRTELNQEVADEDVDIVDLLRDFKRFLNSCTFSKFIIDKIKIESANEEDNEW